MKPDIGKIPELEKFQLENSDWRDGIVVRSPNWLGDAVMTLPAMLQLRKLVPENCGIFVVCPPSLKDFFTAMPIVDLTLPLHAAHKKWSAEDKCRVKRLQAGVCLMFNNSLRDAIHFKLCRVPKLFGAAARGRGFLLAKAWKFPKRLSGELNDFHHAAKYLSMACALGAPEWDGSLPEFVPQKEPELMSKRFLEALSSPKILLLAPGAAYGPAKMWPSEYFARVASDWTAKGGSVFLAGTSKEREVAEMIAADLPEGKVFNMAGETDLCELMMVLQKCEVCLANDSGTMHLAAGVGSKGVAIFGSTDPTSTSPVSGSWNILYEKQECSPCFKRECPKKQDRYSCLKAVTPEKVIAEIEKLTS
jgi:heptosyltransferase-2